MLLKFIGEILRMTHIARGLDSDGALMLDVVVSGHVLQLQSLADVNVKVKLPSDAALSSLIDTYFHISSPIYIKVLDIKS